MKKITGKILFLFLLFYFISLILYYAKIIKSDSFIAACLGGLLSLGNAVAALVLNKNSEGKSNVVYLLYNIGGMGLRMVVMLGVIVLCIKLLKVEVFGFILSFFILYFITLIMEMNYFRKNQENNQTF
jgi:hypothetical protein